MRLAVAIRIEQAAPGDRLLDFNHRCVGHVLRRSPRALHVMVGGEEHAIDISPAWLDTRGTSVPVLSRMRAGGIGGRKLKIVRPIGDQQHDDRRH